MRCRAFMATVAILAAAGWLVAGDTGSADKHPVYVGVRACTRCHSGPAAGHQFSLWRTSEHARAYAALWSPEAKRIARLSGIPQEPQEAVLCLGCHATAAHAEAWEKEEAFSVQDGVQCEHCHGPGSEYMTPEVMSDRKKALAAGLKMPDGRSCMMCHNVKGSHVAVLGSPEFDVKAGMKVITHPTPKGSVPPAKHEGAVRHRADPPAKAEGSTAKRQYAGVMACAACHRGPMMGYQFSRWRLSKHAQAYAMLGTPAGSKIAIEEGVKGDPQASPACLRCHTTSDAAEGRFMPGFDHADGVQCEACHGPGSDYSAEAIMRDPRAAEGAGLLPVWEKTCRPCHGDAHGKKFDYAKAVKAIAHPTRPAEGDKRAAEPRYKTPLNMALSPDGRELYVACEASNTVIIIEVSARSVVAEIETGGQPTDVAFSPDGRRAYVTNRLDDSLTVIDTASRCVIQGVPVGDEPHGVLLDRTGRTIFVLNTSANSISVIAADSLKELRRLSAGQGPWSLALTPDGGRIVATNNLSNPVGFREPSRSELTLVDTDRAIVERRIQVPGANLMQGIAWRPNGEFALFTLNRTKNLVPMTRMLQGWVITNGLGILWADGRVDQVLLDESGMCFPDPTDVAISPDGRLAFVTSSGSDRIAVIDLEKLAHILREATPEERERVLPNHVGKPTEFIVKHIPTKDSPRGVLFAPDGRTAYVANALDDSVTVIDVGVLDAVARIDLGGPTEITKVRYGERLFHSARVTFRRQFSCHSCHPDGHVNGLTFDIEPDGVGILPVDNRTLRGILDTAPFKWEGTNPTLNRECGPRLAVYFTRIDPFNPDELSALVDYICTIPRPPNRYRAVGAELTAAQRRGKAIFERARTNDGRVIPEDNRCVTCHPPPYYTDRSRRNIGTEMMWDRESDFDVPHLNNIYDSAPYLHNGIAHTLEQIWTTYNPYDLHGITNDMTKDQLNDLMEYLKTL